MSTMGWVPCTNKPTNSETHDIAFQAADDISSENHNIIIIHKKRIVLLFYIRSSNDCSSEIDILREKTPKRPMKPRAPLVKKTFQCLIYSSKKTHYQTSVSIEVNHHVNLSVLLVIRNELGSPVFQKVNRHVSPV